MIGNKASENWSFLHVSLGLLFALPLFPSVFRTIIVVIFGLATIFNGIKKRNKFRFDMFLKAAIPYLLIVISILYSDNQGYGVLKLQTMSPLIVFPLLFAWLDHDDIISLYSKLRTYLWIFIISVLLFNLLPFLWFWITNYEFFEGVKHYPEVIVVDIGQYSITPIYMSTLISLAILFSGKVFHDSKRTIDKVILLFVNVILFLFLIVYARKGAIIGLFSVLAIWLFFYLNNLTFKYKLAILIGILFLTFAFPQTRKRFGEMFKVHREQGFVSETVSIRLITFQSAGELIKESPLIGYGIGDYNDLLDENNRKIANHLNIAYNSHNQYLSFLLIGGIILLLSYALFVGNIFRIAIINENKMLIFLLIFYSVLLFIENLLERENGVLYFAFFINFFALFNLTNQGSKVD